jgi:hypothetical protein
LIAAIGAGFALSACATTSSTTASTAGTPTAEAAAAAPTGPGPMRELTAEEKQVIVDAVAPSLRNPGAAKYRWAKFPASAGDDVNYCATVDAQSPFAAYSGHQAYIVETRVSGGRVSSAVVGLIAGGKDTALVAKMCAKYGLNPNNAS